jgi:FkbM family methyltransferase
MKNFDFVEIGTSCFKTLIEEASDTTVGISIEPVKEYIDSLPSKNTVIKIWGAVVPDNSSKELDLYYIEPQDIKEHGLKKFMRGCNSIGKPHDLHLDYFSNLKQWRNAVNKKDLPSINLVEKGIVKKISVPCYTWKDVVENHNVGLINFLKIDTEGMDCKILNSILDYYEKTNNFSLLPKRILFETNAHTDELEVKNIKNRLLSINYKIISEDLDTEVVRD